MASVVMIDLRFIGISGRDQSPQRVLDRFLPVILWALPILLLTGAIIIIGEPARVLKSPVFLLKMALLLAAISVTGVLVGKLRKAGDLSPARGAPPLAALSMLLWIGTVFAGRWIAYF